MSCDVPRDPETTLERVRGDTIRVGIVVNEPWTKFDGSPAGVEADLVEEFARGLDAEITWVEGSEHELMAALKGFELDLVIGGLTADSPWSAEVAFTRPYYTSRLVVGIPEENEVPEDIAGVPVAAEIGTEAAELVEKTDAEVIRVEELFDLPIAAAVETWLLDDLDLQDSGIVLQESAHVIAVPHGENSWLTELETFLAGREQSVGDLLERHGRP
ncbi:MAG: transporter substrate-binding domain-containing protein [Actinomycetota bacterium]